MAKLIVERPRHAIRSARKGKAPRERDELPVRQGMRRPYTESRTEKSLSDNLAPLRRYLLKQVGRPWNKVYSEIRAELRPGHPLHEHLLVHVSDFVSFNVERGQDGVLRVLHESHVTNSVRLLYVDPRTGILRRTVNRRRK